MKLKASPQWQWLCCAHSAHFCWCQRELNFGIYSSYVYADSLGGASGSAKYPLPQVCLVCCVVTFISWSPGRESQFSLSRSKCSSYKEPCFLDGCMALLSLENVRKYVTSKCLSCRISGFCSIRTQEERKTLRIKYGPFSPTLTHCTDLGQSGTLHYRTRAKAQTCILHKE